MKKLWLLLWAAAVFSLTVPGSAFAQEDGISVALSSVPELKEIRPDLDLAEFTLTISDDNGEPLKDVWVNFTLNAPPKPTFISTDFPAIEGTILMQGEYWLRDGVLKFNYVPPIRGEYLVNLEVRPGENVDSSIQPAAETISFTLNENPAEIPRALILLGIIMAIGVISGFVFSRSKHAVEGGAA